MCELIALVRVRVYINLCKLKLVQIPARRVDGEQSLHLAEELLATEKSSLG